MALVLAAVAAWLGLRRLTDDAESRRGPLFAEAPRREATSEELGGSQGRSRLTRAPLEEASEDGTAEASSSPQASDLSSFRDPARFRGRGRIRVVLSAPEGREWPEGLTLHARPSLYLVGRDKAVSREKPIPSGEKEAFLDDLPLGGYEVHVEGPGVETARSQVMLSRGQTSPLVSLSLRALGFLQGQVLDAAGEPAEGLEITIGLVGSTERRTAVTDAAGSYIFRNVRDGDYELWFGYPQNPVLPKESLRFQAPRMTFPTRTLPVTGQARLFITDTSLRGVPDVHVRGWGTKGGNVDVRTDGSGYATARFLPAGRYRLTAETADGRRGKSTLVIEEGVPPDLVRIMVR